MSDKGIVILGIVKTVIIQVLMFYLGNVFAINSYGLLVIPFYLAVDYLAIKYGVVKVFNNNNISIKDNVVMISLLLFVCNFLMFMLYDFVLYVVIICSILPCLIIKFTLGTVDKNRKIEYDTKKAIDEYFSNRKED